MGDQQVSKVERIKAAGDLLRGTLAEELDNGEDRFGGDSTQLLKFHGIYQQDDRDVRKERAKRGLGPDHSCMVRASIPGGRLSAEQYLVMDRLADDVGNGTLRVTTRQGIQYHFTRKGDLRTLIGTLNANLVTTLAACGDVVRNLMCCPAPLADRERADLQHLTRQLSRHLKPATPAYWQLWVDGERAASAVAPPDQEGEVEPLYGPTYLPRKFKVGLAYPGDNCVDVYTHDIGIVPRIARDQVESFTILVGGGLGMTHNKPSTYPRLGDPLCVVPPAELLDTVKAIIGIQRDHGDRRDRKHARLKYLVAEWGLQRFKAELEQRLGRPVEPADPGALDWERTDDHLGWHPQQDGRWFLGVRIQNGRVEDGQVRLRAGLRRIVERFRPEIRFTPRQDVLLCGIREGDRPAVEAELRAHRIPLVTELAPVARHALACPALPTCGLALAEAERVFPAVVDRLQTELESLGLAEEAIHVRMTGCPNGCARPYSTEIGLVGRGHDKYTVFLGGDAHGTRLNAPYADHVALDDVVDLLRPLLAAYRHERRDRETFGDYCHRVGAERLRQRFAVTTTDRRDHERSRREGRQSVSI
ncbi:MAG TPA: NADPH-dependent assimilatory sulfite reductase hemoprotein subunit [Egibacteraceae bacterium]|nr:NADPH-dependent assimilatory sulfite reductase hemoprotein subunit [Actinomycetota bacterium]HWB71879.1 NADPH-dependent assimilatory sulfite reductase hemoprotein subunit [Egibacteraceae bacterium]